MASCPGGPPSSPHTRGSPAPCEHPKSKVREHVLLPTRNTAHAQQRSLNAGHLRFAGDGEARVFSLKFKTSQEKSMLSLIPTDQSRWLRCRPQTSFLLVGLESSPWEHSLKGELGSEENPPPALGSGPAPQGPVRAGGAEGAPAMLPIESPPVPSPLG